MLKLRSAIHNSPGVACSRSGVIFGCALGQDEAFQRSVSAAFTALESAVRDGYGVPAPTPLAPTQW